MNTYLTYYNNNIKPLIENIDIYIKSHPFPTYSYDEIALLLNTRITDVRLLCDQLQIKEINYNDFFTLLKYSNSDVCRLISRQFHLDYKKSYKASDIAYIYQIPYSLITESMNKENIELINEETLMPLFSNIPYHPSLSTKKSSS